MIRNSFIFLDRFGQKKERSIWNQRIYSWNDFLDAKRIKGVSETKKGFFDRKIIEAKDRLYAEDSRYFSRLLPTNEHYRLYDFFKDDALFLDIETATHHGYISVVGMYDGNETKMMVRNRNLNKELLMNEISKYKILVTFNGLSYDVPLIERFFGFKITIPHIDLRHVCSRIGLRGGLKQIERQLDIRRRKEVDGLGGQDACILWQTFMATGSDYYLDLLIKYNEEDTINLKRLADYSIPVAWDKIFKS
ncbi:ribonuclease H-like domain-containing protein [Candidatus Woesearchaeota archaeon]|nr:ribonuclease H-like domain-containing protein [Candidatus Woesearchaeota archaeon]